MQYYELQFTPVFTVTACCNLDVQYLSSTCRIELRNYCMNVFTEWWAFLCCHYNQFNEAIDTP